MRRVIQAYLVGLSVAFSGFVWSGVNDPVVTQFLGDLQGEDLAKRITVCRRVYEFGGFQDERLFDLMAERVRKNYESLGGGNRLIANEYAWYVKALGASGQEKYLLLVAEVASGAKLAKLKKYAKSTRDLADYYKELNRGLAGVPFLSASNDARKITAYKQLLKSKNSEVKKTVYRRIYNYSGIQDAELFSSIAQDVRDNIEKGLSNSDQLDEFAWRLKALSASGDGQYLSLLEEAANVEVHNTEAETKLARYISGAKQNLPVFTRWNTVLVHQDHEQEGRDPRISDWMDLLKFGDTRMQIYAVRQAFGFDVYEEDLNQLIVETLGYRYSKKTRDKYELDFYSWVCRWLGKYQSEESRVLLKKILSESSSAKVKGYARKALKLYKD